MEKWKRSSRLIDMTQFLLASPYKLHPLSLFTARYQAAKSSISEDLTIIEETFKREGRGRLDRVAGAAGGVRYIPLVNRTTIQTIVQQLCERLAQPERILPGGFLYLSDLLGDPYLLQQLGGVFATLFAEQEIDAILTVETKGIPLAYATAFFLQAPVVIARYAYRVTEGSVVTVNTMGSNQRIRPLSLAKRSLQEGSRVLVIDDFMKAGGTIYGMMELLAEFRAKVVGIGVMVESPVTERKVDQYLSLAKIQEFDQQKHKITVEPGNIQFKMDVHLP